MSSYGDMLLAALDVDLYVVTDAQRDDFVIRDGRYRQRIRGIDANADPVGAFTEALHTLRTRQIARFEAEWK